ncbi:hypothetical protein IMZ38_07190 [Thermosphaera chiliense]|uniref:Uncharacterized protein n=1 Tax=Thermosphaera chiliense TaxID=3402707 RepID=A0A7M1UQ34_9CREN|nr:hypothetical protein [Thermosphaera aggregans]QOR94378.1 hypothetical protein IMZ38_07190 [Thermosphaera aggregans]
MSKAKTSSQGLEYVTLEDALSMLQYSDLANAFSSMAEKPWAGRVLKRVTTATYTLIDVQRDIDDFFIDKIVELLDGTKSREARSYLNSMTSLSELVNVVVVLHNVSIGRKPVVIFPTPLARKIPLVKPEEFDIDAFRRSVDKVFAGLVDRFVESKELSMREIALTLHKSVANIDKVSNYRVWRIVGIYHDAIAVRLCRMFPELSREPLYPLIMEDNIFREACSADLTELAKTSSGYRKIVLELFDALADSSTILKGVEAFDLATVLTTMSLSKTLAGGDVEERVRRLVRLMGSSVILKLIVLSIYTDTYKVELQRLLSKWLK